MPTIMRQVWPSFAALLLAGLASALIEVALFSYLSRIIDLVNHSTPATLFSNNWPRQQRRRLGPNR